MTGVLSGSCHKCFGKVSRSIVFPIATQAVALNDACMWVGKELCMCEKWLLIYSEPVHTAVTKTTTTMSTLHNKQSKPNNAMDFFGCHELRNKNLPTLSRSNNFLMGQ